EGGLTGALNRDTVRHGVGKRHAYFDDIRTRGNGLKVLAKLALAGISGCQEPNQGRRTTASGGAQGLTDRVARVHGAPASNVFCSVGISLAPRPDRQTRIRAPG